MFPCLLSLSKSAEPSPDSAEFSVLLLPSPYAPLNKTVAKLILYTYYKYVYICTYVVIINNI